MSQLAERTGGLVSEFDAFRRDPAFGAGGLGRRREAALDRFLERGFPTTRDEDWRFTNVAPIAKEFFGRALAASPSRQDIAPYLFAGAGLQIVLINGRVSKPLSSLDTVPAGVTVHTGAAAIREEHDEHNGRLQPVTRPGPFADLNEAFFEEAVAIHVAPRTAVSAPIHIVAVSVADGAVMVAPRVLLHVGEAAEVSFVETFATLGSGSVLTTAVTEIHAEPAAVVHHVKIQRESDAAFHMGTMDVRLDRASTVTSHALTFGGRIARNDITALLGGEGAECTLNGLYVATGDSVVDTHTTIDHAMPHCPSHEVYKGILGGRSRAVFNGKILVRPDAQKTDAKQTNRALLLTDDAQVNTKPQLEIFADDVKCTHGAAIGQLDEDAMFYLRARGISEQAARVMLIHAFAGQILEGIAVAAVRELAAHLVDRKLSIE